EAADVPEERTADGERSAGNVVDVARLVVLAAVDLAPASLVRKAVRADDAARALDPPVGEDELAPRRADARIADDGCDECLDSVDRWAGVRVQEEEDVAACVAGAGVAAGGEAEVAPGLDERRAGQGAADARRGAVAARVVDDDGFEGCIAETGDRGAEGYDELGGVERDGDDRDEGPWLGGHARRRE